MNRKVSLLLVVVYSFCWMLNAQKRDDGVEVKVDNLQATPVGVSITLRASDSHDTVHMMIGFAEGQSIMRAMHHEKGDRPLSHDLFKAFLDRNGWHVQKVLIRDVKDGRFTADLTIENEEGRETETFDARPSDAMAMGLRYGAKIFVTPQAFADQKKGEDDENDDTKPSEPEQLKL